MANDNLTDQNQGLQEQELQGVTDKNIQIQRIYMKDCSFEAPNLPAIFDKQWTPELKFSINTEAKDLGESNYEVAITLSIETLFLNEGEEPGHMNPDVEHTTAFICELTQAGIFTITGFIDFELAHALNAQCPNILFPYAREAVANLVNRGTFPALNLTPVNFDQLFLTFLEQQQQAQAAANQEQVNN